MEFEDKPLSDDVVDSVEVVGDEAATATDWDMLAHAGDQQFDSGQTFSDELSGDDFGEAAEATRFPAIEGDLDGADPYTDVVAAWRATHEQDVALYGSDSEEAATSDQRLADAEWTLLQHAVPDIDDTGELAALEDQLAEYDHVEVDEPTLPDDEQEVETVEDDGEGGDTAVLDHTDNDPDESTLNTSPELANHLRTIIETHERGNRGLSKNEGKRLKETPAVPQEEMSGLLEVLLHTTLPTVAYASGWEELKVQFGKQDDLASMHIFTFPQEISTVTPQVIERIDIPKQQGKLSGIVDAALGRPGEYIEAEVAAPDEAYFEYSNLMCHHEADKQRVASATAHPNGMRNPGPNDYDEGMLRSIGVRNYVNSDSQYQYVVRAEIGVNFGYGELSTRYVVYETTRDGGGYAIARSDNDFSSRRGLKATTYIPDATEVRQLRDLIWVMLNSSSEI